jgi:D-alanyl-D-alanine carboxypeptidase
MWGSRVKGSAVGAVRWRLPIVRADWLRGRLGFVGRGAAGVMVVAALLAGVFLASPSAGASSRATRAAALTRAITTAWRQTSIPGAIVGVWQKGAAPYVRTLGVRDTTTRRPMTANLYMRIGSDTKTFTVTAVLQLVDKRKVRLRDPISKYISGVPGGNRISLRELAEMRSGLSNYSDDGAFHEALASDPRRQFKPSELLAYSFRHPLMFAPGSEFFYSNTNTVLLGLVVEKVSRQPLAVYIKQHILKPEHLTHTVFPSGAAFPSPHAQGYAELPNGTSDVTDWNPSWAWAAGAMVSTLDDLRVWARDVATGTLLTRATQKQRDRFISAPALGGAYGLGLFRANGWIGHGGVLPGYQSLAIYLPSAQATIVVLLNSDTNPKPRDARAMLARAITKIITPKHVFNVPSG